jgi:hypothetical protein
MGTEGNVEGAEGADEDHEKHENGNYEFDGSAGHRMTSFLLSPFVCFVSFVVQYLLHAIVGLMAGNDPILARSSRQRINLKRFHQIANERRHACRGEGPIESIVHIEVGSVNRATTDCGDSDFTYYRLWLCDFARRPEEGSS